MKSKECRKCHDEKPLTEFAVNANGLGGRVSWCKPCMADNIRCLRITRREADAYPLNAVCAICGGVNKNGKHLSLDHDHATGKFRGWLCSHCNSGLGWFKDNASIMAKAIEYLNRN